MVFGGSTKCFVAEHTSIPGHTVWPESVLNKKSKAGLLQRHSVYITHLSHCKNSSSIYSFLSLVCDDGKEIDDLSASLMRIQEIDFGRGNRV